VADVIAFMDKQFPPSLAAEWDSVGLVCGDPDTEIERILLGIDPSDELAMEACDRDAGMVITHHPLYLSGVTSVAPVDTKGRAAHLLISNQISLFTAHTNADAANPGVSDAMARALGLTDLELLDDVTGIGRVGTLPQPMMLAEFAKVVAANLPFTMRGINVAGALTWPVQRIAVCGGSGSDYLEAADAAAADVFVTADLKHHAGFDHMAEGGCFLIDVSHWASEWPWLIELQAQLQKKFPRVEVVVSEECTDIWTAHFNCPDPEL
jgi:dinuclear metal center YbgI/SA1388 family protein